MGGGFAEMNAKIECVLACGAQSPLDQPSGGRGDEVGAYLGRGPKVGKK